MIFFSYLAAGIFGLIWGSFLNVVATRGLQSESLGGRSRCSHCKTQLRWFHIIPIFSWIALGARCHSCKKPISILYPIIEILTAGAFIGLWAQYSENIPTCIAYSFFFSALIVSIRTDFEEMMLLDIATRYCVPVGILCSFLGILPISVYESIVGAFAGYAILWLLRAVASWWFNQEAMGLGDAELLAMIGSFTGFLGVAATIILGSWLGTIYGIFRGISERTFRGLIIPFGPFLALGAIIFVLFEHLF